MTRVTILLMYIARVERVHLARILRRDGGVRDACREAVLAGGRFWVTENVQPASKLAATYALRERHTLERGIGTVGFAEAVADLRARGDDLVRVGGVETEGPSYHFQLFLDERAIAVVACLGVDRSRRRHSPDTPR